MTRNERTAVQVVIRSATDRIGKTIDVFYYEDGLFHDLPHSTPVYNTADEFLGEVVATGGVWKATIDGDTSWVGAWDSNFRRAVQNVALMAHNDPTFMRGHRAS